jgi:hypothetical protein
MAVYVALPDIRARLLRFVFIFQCPFPLNLVQSEKKKKTSTSEFLSKCKFTTPVTIRSDTHSFCKFLLKRENKTIVFASSNE